MEDEDVLENLQPIKIESFRKEKKKIITKKIYEIAEEKLRNFNRCIQGKEASSLEKDKEKINLAKNVNAAFVKMNPMPMVLSTLAVFISLMALIKSDEIPPIIICFAFFGMVIIATTVGYYGIKFKWYYPIKEENNYMYDKAISMIEKEMIGQKKI